MSTVTCGSNNYVAWRSSPVLWVGQGA